MTVHDAIAAAERVLPGARAPERELDPRWQAIIAVGAWIEREPDAVWAFARRWASSADEDLQAAVATCLLEHLLEHHFERLFPAMQDAALDSPEFATALRMSWKLGRLELPANAHRFDELLRKIDNRSG